MFDPAALATTIIGLEGIRRDQELYDRGVARPARARSRQRPLRRVVAGVLRRAAERIGPAPMPAR